jgi:aryl-alcohol dehydrogenase-like predicted oxidoreductase
MTSKAIDQVVLGRTGLKVSVAGLGAGGDSRLGLKQGTHNAIRIVRTAFDHGVNFLDTAEAYGTEEVIGLVLKDVPRDRVVLSTKKTTNGGQALERQAIVSSLEASLKRLGTDYVDVYHLHGVAAEDYSVLRERAVPVLLELRQQGKIRYLGITEKFAVDPGHRMLGAALDDDVWDVMMVGFNLLNQSARERVFARTRARGIGTLIMFAVRRALSRPDRLREVLTELAQRGDLTPRQADEGLSFLVGGEWLASLPDAAYRYCRHEPGADVILTGTGSEAHLLENLASIQRGDLPREHRAQLAALFRNLDHLSGQ